MHRILAAALALILGAAPALAQDEADIANRAQDVADAINGEAVYTNVFADSFIGQVPEAQFQALSQQLRSQLGAFVGLESAVPTGETGAAKISLRFENAIASGPMQLQADEPYKIAGLLINEIGPVDDEGLTPLAQVQALPGLTNILFARLDGSQVLAQHNADAPLAIGSTFKLYVLSALSRSIAEGARNWDDVVHLSQRSFPSGQMQNWPQGSAVTLQTLATMMISISDNTATDQLIHELGREAVEAEMIASGHSAPSANQPFMTTREMFLLKLSQDDALAAYVAAGEDVRRASLAQLAGRELDMAQVQNVFGNGPRFIDVEWFASPNDIARIFARLKDDPVALDILGVNLAMDPARFDGWAYAGYKGGSEPGVLNFSWLLQDESSEWWVLTMGWNNADAALSEMQFLGLAQQFLAQ